MVFDTVFDASQQGLSPYSFAAFGLIFVAVGCLLVFASGKMEVIFRGGLKGWPRKIFGYFFLIFSVCWTASAFVDTYMRQEEIGKYLAGRDVNIVDGPVENFHPMPSSGHGWETFQVGGKDFSYSDYVITGGFNQTSTLGGPVHAGEYVRIAYRDGEILRLEIARPGP